MLKDAIWFNRKQWAYTKLGFGFTLAFYATYGGLAGMFSGDWFEEMETFQAVMTDFVVLAFMSCVGFVFSKGYLNNPYWKNDAFTKRLATLRTHPIPVETLAMSRSVQLAAVSPLSAAVFFGVFYAVSEWAQSLHPATFLQFAFVWLAFGNVCGAWFVLQEWGASGKQYLLRSVYAMLAYVAAGAVLYVTTKKHVTIGLAEAIDAPGGWVWTLAALAAAVAAHVWMQRRLRRILHRRDFA
ncbi:hypothetical protein [Paenibacillus sp.]|uniref:hypothetical protein n=1 Tax=Paenibacillus sp. TaxID=58172 RepID=UPI002D2C6B57|nr:hypothetical protein [Paenibacillus sp.]HZG55752.1 hypothetical protein [Paenibacillus sp.]